MRKSIHLTNAPLYRMVIGDEIRHYVQFEGRWYYREQYSMGGLVKYMPWIRSGTGVAKHVALEYITTVAGTAVFDGFHNIELTF